MACVQHAAQTCRLLDTATGLHCFYRDSHLAGLPIPKPHTWLLFATGLHHTRHIGQHGTPFGIAIGVGQGGPDDIGKRRYDQLTFDGFLRHPTQHH